MKEFTFNCYWEMCGTVTVKAEDEESARDLAAEGSLPPGSYVSDSFEVQDLNEVEEPPQPRTGPTPFNEADCGGVFDGNSVTSDADPGL